jgi:hypothetical protein
MEMINSSKPFAKITGTIFSKAGRMLPSFSGSKPEKKNKMLGTEMALSKESKRNER